MSKNGNPEDLKPRRNSVGWLQRYLRRMIDNGLSDEPLDEMPVASIAYRSTGMLAFSSDMPDFAGPASPPYSDSDFAADVKLFEDLAVGLKEVIEPTGETNEAFADWVRPKPPEINGENPPSADVTPAS